MSGRKQLLFVDDDEKLLQGIKRCLRKKHKEWSMHFASSGVQAIEFVEANDVDIIITDMRMPNIDGPRVLEKVREISPKTIRLVLSGQACKELVMRVIQYAHIFLAKPCSQERLLKILERACTLHNSLPNNDIQKAITQLERIPCFPESYDSLMKEVKSENASLEKIALIIAADPSMSCKVLQIVNSAFFSLPRNISAAYQAVNILGVETISSMLLECNVFDPLNNEVFEKFKLEALYNQLKITSLLSKEIATREGLSTDQINVASTAGLLHNIGSLIMAHSNPILYQQVIDKTIQENVAVEDAERYIYQSTSEEISAYLLGIWGLPQELINAVLYHRSSDNKKNEEGKLTISSIVNIANKIYLSGEIDQWLDIESLKKIGVMNNIQLLDKNIA